MRQGAKPWRGAANGKDRIGDGAVTLQTANAKCRSPAMSVTVSKLQGDEIPEHLRGPDIRVVYRVTDAEGHSRYLTDAVEAAQLAVSISDRQQR